MCRVLASVKVKGSSSRVQAERRKRHKAFVSEHRSGSCPQEISINMLQCCDFVQSHVYSLKSHLSQYPLLEISLKECECEETQLPKSNAPSQFLTATNNNAYNQLKRTTAWLNDKKRDACNSDAERLFINAVEEQEHQLMWDGGSNASEVQTAEEKGAWPVDDSEPSQESTLDNESRCSVCEDQTASDDGSPGRDVLDTPSSRILLRYPMLGTLCTAWKKQFSIRPLLPETPIVPRHAPVRRADTLILSPTLLTSPSEGLNHPLLPEGQKTLQTLFEDVWVSPESTTLQSPRLTNEMIPPWHTFYHGYQRVSQSMACHVQETFVLPESLRFSCQQNRNVRSVVNEEEMEAGDPSPLHSLLAHSLLSY